MSIYIHVGREEIPQLLDQLEPILPELDALGPQQRSRLEDTLGAWLNRFVDEVVVLVQQGDAI